MQKVIMYNKLKISGLKISFKKYEVPTQEIASLNRPVIMEENVNIVKKIISKTAPAPYNFTGSLLRYFKTK